MLSFCDVPNELLCALLESVQPEDLGNFAQISKHVYLVSQPYLQTHRQLIRKHSILQKPMLEEEKTFAALTGVLPEVLMDVLRNPRIGSYIRSIQLGRFEPPYGKITSYEQLAPAQQNDWLDIYHERNENFGKAALDSKFHGTPSHYELDNWNQALDLCAARSRTRATYNMLLVDRRNLLSSL